MERELNSRRDLDELYNHLFQQNPKFRVISKERFHELAFRDGNPEFYKVFRIPKPNGKYRVIEEPIPDLKLIQKCLLSILHKYPLAPEVYGLGGNNFIQNAKKHAENRVVIKIDILRFFPETTDIYFDFAVTRALSLRFIDKELADTLRIAQSFFFLTDRRGIRRLPTGAPTSPIVSSICFSPLDEVLQTEALCHNLVYSRYIDDLIFSGPEYPEGFQKRVVQIVQEYGYRVNHEKSQVLYADNHNQEITGITVNSSHGIPKTYRQNLRAELDHHARHSRELNESLQGKLAYVYQINPPLRDKFQKYFSKRVTYWHNQENRVNLDA